MALRTVRTKGFCIFLPDTTSNHSTQRCQLPTAYRKLLRRQPPHPLFVSLHLPMGLTGFDSWMNRSVSMPSVVSQAR